jgi:hypothetical protein
MPITLKEFEIDQCCIKILVETAYQIITSVCGRPFAAWVHEINVCCKYMKPNCMERYLDLTQIKLGSGGDCIIGNCELYYTLLG